MSGRTTTPNEDSAISLDVVGRIASAALVPAQPSEPLETITEAAVRVLTSGANHAQCIGQLKTSRPEQGFLTSSRRFVDRREALAIATKAGQLEGRHKHEPIDKLMSEDLWGEPSAPNEGEK
jgi:hypothetical protein